MVMDIEALKKEIEHNRELIAKNKRRLQALEQKQAFLGVSADVAIEMEISDIKQDIRDCEATIHNLEKLLFGPAADLIKQFQDSIFMQMMQGGTGVELITNLQGILASAMQDARRYEATIFIKVEQTDMIKSDIISLMR
jgi:hypothetical protein